MFPIVPRTAPPVINQAVFQTPFHSCRPTMVLLTVGVKNDIGISILRNA